MAGRIRSIKPEAHKDAELWDAEQETGLPLFRAYTALWGQADREGRFVWKPRELKIECLPYWEGEFSRVLDALETRGFLVRYQHGGREYGWIRTFKKHQFINGKEPESKLPAPPESALISDVSRVTNVRPTCVSREADTPIPSLPLPDPVPDPNPAPDAQPGEAEAPSPAIGAVGPLDDERETMIPLDFEARVIAAGLPNLLAERLKIPVVQVLDRLRNFCGYWGAGAGMGQRKKQWMRAFREDVRQALERGQLRAPGVIAHNAARAAEDPPAPPSPAHESFEDQERAHADRLAKAVSGTYGAKLAKEAPHMAPSELRRVVEAAERRRPQPAAGAVAGVLARANGGAQ